LAISTAAITISVAISSVPMPEATWLCMEGDGEEMRSLQQSRMNSAERLHDPA
jgi:hypothetical protein